MGIIRVPINRNNFLNPGRLTADEQHKKINLVPCYLLPYGLASWRLERERKWPNLRAYIMDMGVKCPREEEKILLKPLLNLCRRSSLKTKKKKKRCQVEVESIMDPSRQMDKILED